MISGKVTRGISLPEQYITCIRWKRLDLSAFTEWALSHWRALGRTDFPRLQKGRTKRKNTTITLAPGTAYMVTQYEAMGFSLSAFVESNLMATYPSNFYPDGLVAYR